MSGRVLLYGATGLSGRLIARSLADLGERLVLAGRSADGLRPLASELGLEARVFDLAGDFDGHLADIAVVLNAAGPFRDTAAPMLAACLRTRTDYLDIAGEWPVFVAAMALDAPAREAGIMVMPGAGFSIAATDCLLAIAADTPGTVRLRLGVSRPGGLARGSVRTMLGLNDSKVRVRRGGAIVALPAGSLSHDFDFGQGPRRAVAVTWPDVFTAATGPGAETPDIETYAEADTAGHAAVRAGGFAASWGQGRWSRAAGGGGLARAAGEALAGVAVALYPAEIDPAAQAQGFVIVAEAVDRWRRATALRLRTGDGHAVTTIVADASVRRILAGERRPGFTTPARHFGARFIVDLGCAVLDPPLR